MKETLNRIKAFLICNCGAVITCNDCPYNNTSECDNNNWDDERILEMINKVNELLNATIT